MTPSIALRSFAGFALLATVVSCQSEGRPDSRAGASAEPATVTPSTLGSIANVAKAGGSFYIAGQPNAADWEAIRAAGIVRVVNLRAASELAYDEEGVARAAGLEYVQVPFSPEALTDRDIEAFVAAMAGARGRPVLVHCGSGNRAGAAWALYRIRHDGLDLDSALAEGRAAGMKSPKLEETIRAHAK